MRPIIMRGLKTALYGTLIVTSAACGVRRPYVAPDVPPAVLSHVDTALTVEQPFDPRWWQQFEDPVLDDLVAKALAANHDVRMAVARVDQARAFFDDVALDRFPTAVAGASVDRRDQAIPGFSERPRPITTYRAGFDAFWEIDIFGRVRSQVRAAQASAEGFAAELDDVRVSVAAEVARNYFELRGLQRRCV
jgi:outer membrane protein TolC